MEGSTYLGMRKKEEKRALLMMMLRKRREIDSFVEAKWRGRYRSSGAIK